MVSAILKRGFTIPSSTAVTINPPRRRRYILRANTSVPNGYPSVHTTNVEADTSLDLSYVHIRSSRFAVVVVLAVLFFVRRSRCMCVFKLLSNLGITFHAIVCREIKVRALYSNRQVSVEVTWIVCLNDGTENCVIFSGSSPTVQFRRYSLLLLYLQLSPSLFPRFPRFCIFPFVAFSFTVPQRFTVFHCLGNVAFHGRVGNWEKRTRNGGKDPRKTHYPGYNAILLGHSSPTVNKSKSARSCN